MTKNFTKKEFDSNCGCEMPINVYYNIVKVANQLQVLRNEIQKPIHVNSAYRSECWNAKIGGAHKIDKKGNRIETSQHVFGRAADIVVKGMTPLKLSKVIERLISNGDMLQGGLGVYEKKGFVHYDIRGTKTRWNG